ncbi:MAG: hypothetical protein K8R16_09805 [Anaerolineales bacterium]|nr:hypothetical protein [Anaerolineales bacterium]
MNDQEQKIDQLVKEALRTFPLEPVPDRVLKGILAQIERPISQPAFLFSWIDFSLSAVLAVIIGLLLNMIQQVIRSSYWSARLRVEILLMWQEMRLFLMQNQTEVLAAAISILTLFTLLSILAGIYRRQAAYAESVVL